MVSFQCEGCGDVVKKPKLDNHRSSCHSAFTCIDCSTTFQGPAEYKSHTQCISEAEKYQKSLYKGQKGQNQKPSRNDGQRSQFVTNGQQSRNQAPTGKYQSWGNNGTGDAHQPWGRGYQRYEGTGANETPLGTPTRMSPITTPATPAAESKVSETAKGQGKAVNGASEPVRDKKDHKRKSESTQSDSTTEPRKKKAKTESGATEPAADSLVQQDNVDKKSKKSKKEKRQEAVAETNEGTVKEEARVEKKTKKGKKADREADTDDIDRAETALDTKKGADDSAQPEAVSASEGCTKKSKSKKPKDTVSDGVLSAKVESPAKEKGEKKAKKEKKHKKSKSDVSVATS